jgi:hypothetical protein
MLTERDNETWVIEAGDAVIRKQAERGDAALSPVEKLIYCLWVADYGMRNAGDLETASDHSPSFQEDALRAATELGLPRSIAAFSLPTAELQRRYFELFDGLCREIGEDARCPYRLTTSGVGSG